MDFKSIPKLFSGYGWREVHGKPFVYCVIAEDRQIWLLGDVRPSDSQHVGITSGVNWHGTKFKRYASSFDALCIRYLYVDPHKIVLPIIENIRAGRLLKNVDLDFSDFPD